MEAEENYSPTGVKKPPKSSENKYPGLGYILFVKSLHGSAKTESWFECILCAAGKMMAPKEMTIHLRSYNHLCSVMEVECPKNLWKYKTEDESNSQEMLKEILEYESQSATQTMMAANPENVPSKRKELIEQINLTKIKNSSPVFNVPPPEVKSSDDELKNTKVSINNDWENDSEDEAYASKIKPKSTCNEWEDEENNHISKEKVENKEKVSVKNDDAQGVNIEGKRSEELTYEMNAKKWEDDEIDAVELKKNLLANKKKKCDDTAVIEEETQNIAEKNSGEKDVKLKTIKENTVKNCEKVSIKETGEDKNKVKEKCEDQDVQKKIHYDEDDKSTDKNKEKCEEDEDEKYEEYNAEEEKDYQNLSVDEKETVIDEQEEEIEENYDQFLRKEDKLSLKSVDMSNYELFQQGFQGKQFIMAVLESLKEIVAGNLTYSRSYVYYNLIEKSYMCQFIEGKSNRHSKSVKREEIDFVQNSIKSLYLDSNILSYCHKPVLPISKDYAICKAYHEALGHPNCMTLFEILSREFFSFSETTLKSCEEVQASCEVCSFGSEPLTKVHSFKILEAYNEWPNRREMKALNFSNVTNMSYARNPSKIVVIGDERDEYLKNLNMPDVSVRICPGLNLENAFDFISCDSSFGHGVLFVVLCGSFTFVRWEIDPECQRKGCPEPLLLPSVVKIRESDLYIYAMNAARNLHQSVMLNSAKDDVIFGHVLPIALNSNAWFLAHSHNRKFKHMSRHHLLSNPQKESYVSLNIAILNYNGWADKFSSQLGYPSWGLSAGFFAEIIQNKKKIFKFNLGKLKEDGVNFTSITQSLRKEMIQELCKSTLSKLQTKEKNGLLKNFVSITNPLVTRTCNSLKFDKVLIFCEKESKILLNIFSSSQTWMFKGGPLYGGKQGLGVCEKE